MVDRMRGSFGRGVGWGIAGILCVGFAGCAETQPSTFPVTLKIAYSDGKPVVGAHVVTRPEDGKSTARGTTGPDGTCRLTTFKPDDGAVPGRHLVMVAQPPVIGDPDAPYTGPQIASKFASFNTSGLEMTVIDDEAKNVITLTVTPR